MRCSYHLDALQTVVKAWEMLYKEDHPLRLDLQAIIITDLMERSLKTAPDYKKHSLDKYRKVGEDFDTRCRIRKIQNCLVESPLW